MEETCFGYTSVCASEVSRVLGGGLVPGLFQFILFITIFTFFLVQ
jgi:hypothetical protein